MTKRVQPTLLELERLFDRSAAMMGVLVWNRRKDVAAKWNTRYAGHLAGKLDVGGYLRVSIHKREFANHRLIWCIANDVEPRDIVHLQVDHIDHNRIHNHPSNLRPCTQAQNNRNRNGSSESAFSQHLHVSFHKASGLWRVTCRDFYGKQLHLGYFKTELLAATAATAYRETSPCSFRQTAAHVRVAI